MKQRTKVIIWVVIVLLLLGASVVVGQFVSTGETESVQEAMRDAVLHEHGKISLFGIIDVNPSLISGFIVTGALLLFALIMRIFVIPRFKKTKPSGIQKVLELAVGFFDGLAKENSPHRNKFLGAYIFAAGAYIFFGTLFELLGVQMINIHGTPMALPAPLADINGAICMGCLSYLVIMSGGIASNGIKGVGMTLKDFSLPISMSFRLFGALLSGLLVTEMVYFFKALSYGLPVVVGVLFTLLHALIQAYVLTLLVSIFYGEVSEHQEKKKKVKNQTEDTKIEAA